MKSWNSRVKSLVPATARSTWASPRTERRTIDKSSWKRPLTRFPAVREIYRFKQRLCYLLLKKHRTRKQCTELVNRFLKALQQLKQSGLAQLVQLGHTLSSWSVEIATMWRFTRNNGITEGFHTKMEVLQRQAYGFRNFKNYRLRVRVTCG